VDWLVRVAGSAELGSPLVTWPGADRFEGVGATLVDEADGPLSFAEILDEKLLMLMTILSVCSATIPLP
jgi:hypothetical protein